MTWSPIPARQFRNCLATVLGLASAHAIPASAEDFALSISPPRFELSAEPGETVRGVFELANASSLAATLEFATAEWELAPDGGVITSKVLKEDSCRPWVAIERPSFTLQPKSQLRYRFEVTPPPETQPTECRFAILVSGSDQRVSPSEQTSFPVAAQIAIIVYVAVGEVRPELRVVKADVVEVGGVLSPVIMVENSGTAHGRLSAFLKGADAAGKKREFSVSTLPVLPGETRMLALNVETGGDVVAAGRNTPAEDGRPDPIQYPLTMSGKMNDTVNTFSFDGVFEP